MPARRDRAVAECQNSGADERVHNLCNVEELSAEYVGEFGEIATTVDSREHFPLLRNQSQMRKLLRVDVNEGRYDVSIGHAIAHAAAPLKRAS